MRFRSLSHLNKPFELSSTTDLLLLNRPAEMHSSPLYWRSRRDFRLDVASRMGREGTIPLRRLMRWASKASSEPGLDSPSSNAQQVERYRGEHARAGSPLTICFTSAASRARVRGRTPIVSLAASEGFPQRADTIASLPPTWRAFVRRVPGRNSQLVDLPQSVAVASDSASLSKRVRRPSSASCCPTADRCLRQRRTSANEIGTTGIFWT